MDPPLPIDGVLPPDLAGTLVRIGPGATSRGALHAIELRDGAAVSYLSGASDADANVFWHAGSLLALAESGLPERFSRQLQPETFDGGLTSPIASHAHRDPNSDGRVLFSVEAGEETPSPSLRVGEWDRGGALVHFLEVGLERASWHHDLGVTRSQLAFFESPTALAYDLADEAVAVPYRFTPGEPTMIATVRRDGDGTDVRRHLVDPALVTHMVGAFDRPDPASVVLYVVRYPVPEAGQPFDFDAPVVGPAGIGRSRIGGGLGTLERWDVGTDAVEQSVVDERHVEYVSIDPTLEGRAFRHAYGVEVAQGAPGSGHDETSEVDALGLVQFDLGRDQVRRWSPGPYQEVSEPLFVRAADGTADDEGWLLVIVDDHTRSASDLYVLDASSFGRRAPEAVIHLPASLPFLSHGTWVGAERYR